MVLSVAVEAVASALVDLGARAESRGRGTISKGERPIEVRREPGWLVLEQAGRESDLNEVWRALESAARTEGRYQRALGLESRRIHVRVEIALEEPAENDLAGVLTDVLARWPGSASEADTAPPGNATDPGWLEDLEHACIEGGWSVDRGPSELIVRWRSARGRSAEATLRRSGDLFTVRCELGRLDALPDASQAAIAVFLAAAAHTVRGVATAIVGEPPSFTAALVTAVPVAGPPGAIDTALSACAVARDQVEAELDALRDEKIARQYLEVTGWHSFLPSFHPGEPS